jgi:hypothetical protein
MPNVILCSDATIDLLATARGKRFGTILADPPWQFQNRTGKVAPEHKRLNHVYAAT